MSLDTSPGGAGGASPEVVKMIQTSAKRGRSASTTAAIPNTVAPPSGRAQRPGRRHRCRISLDMRSSGSLAPMRPNDGDDELDHDDGDHKANEVVRSGRVQSLEGNKKKREEENANDDDDEQKQVDGAKEEQKSGQFCLSGTGSQRTNLSTLPAGDKYHERRRRAARRRAEANEPKEGRVERSSSITSGYNSTSSPSQNSTPISTRRQPVQQQHYQIGQRARGTTIYENPAFCGPAQDRLQQATMDEAARVQRNRPTRPANSGRSIYTSCGVEQTQKWPAKADPTKTSTTTAATRTTTTATATATTTTTSSTSSGASSGSCGQTDANSDYTQHWRRPNEDSDKDDSQPDGELKQCQRPARRRDWRRRRQTDDQHNRHADDDLLGRANSSLLNGFGRDCGSDERRRADLGQDDGNNDDGDDSQRSDSERQGRSPRLAADEFEWCRVELRRRDNDADGDEDEDGDGDGEKREAETSKHVPNGRAKLEHAAELYAHFPNHYLESSLPLPFATSHSAARQLDLTSADNINKQSNYDQPHYQHHHHHQQHYQQLRRQPNSFELAHMQQPNQQQQQQPQLQSQRLPNPPRGFGQADEGDQEDDELVAMETAAANSAGLPSVDYADPHLYCAVTGSGGTLRPAPRQQVGPRLPQLFQQDQQHYFQYQPKQLIHKSPTSLTLNHSYQTLVERLNESRYNQPTQTAYRALIHGQQQQQQQFYLTQQNHSPPFYLNHQQQHHLPATLAQINCLATASPLFSSLNTNNSAATTPPNGSATQQDLFKTFKTGLAADPNGRSRKYYFERGHRSPKWCCPFGSGAAPKRLRSPWCGLVRLLMLLLAGLLLLASIFLVPVWQQYPSESQTRHESQRELMRSVESEFLNGLSHYQPAPPGGPNLNRPASRPQVPSGTLLPIEHFFGPIFQQQTPSPPLPPPTVIKQSADGANDLTRLPPSMTNVATSRPPITSGGATPASGGGGQVELMASSTQSYWLLNDDAGGREPALASLINFCGLSSSSPSSSSSGLVSSECNGNGKCHQSSGMCSCLSGFSGPTCANAQCPNGCLGRGECKLRRDWPLNELHEHQLDSVGFQSAGWARWRLSACADRSLLNGTRTGSWPPRSFGLANKENDDSSSSSSNNNNHKLFDNRLQWQCECQPEWTGADCSQERELNCADQLDNDQDGLADCEDDDCCAQPACRDNLMCYKPPEPQTVLSQPRPIGARLKELEMELNLSSSTPDSTGGRSSFFVQWQFLIDPNSIQSYAKRDAFDPTRVAVIRGRVLAQGSDANELASTNQLAGIVSVRVGVLENASFGFTLTRQDGHFDLLVNGNEWLTLQFLRNAYTPIKQRIFVRAHTINVLETNVLMGLARRDETNGGGGGSGSGNGGASEPVERRHQSGQASPFGLRLVFELRQLVDQHQRQAHAGLVGRQRDDELARAQLFECLLNEAQRRYIQSCLSNGLQTDSQLEPEIVQLGPTNRSGSLRLFALASPSSTAFATSLRGGGGGGGGGQDRFRTANSSLKLEELEIVYNSAAFPSAASVAKPVVVLQLLPDDFEARRQRLASSGEPHFRLEAVHIQLDIEGQSRRERLEPVNGLSYQFAWNRRNVYGQKVYGFSELSIRVDYQFQLASTINPRNNNKQPADSGGQSLSLAGCLETSRELSSSDHLRRQSLEAALATLTEIELKRRTRSFAGRIHVEAHQLNQHADVGRWALATSARLDVERQSIYFGTGWTLPLELVYPPTVSEPIPIQPTGRISQPKLTVAGHAPGRRLMTKGPNSSLFLALVGESKRLVQLDAGATRRLIDLPLAMLMGKFQSKLTNNTSEDDQDLELVYNNFESALYISSRQAGKLIRVSLASLVALNKTLASSLPPASIELDEVLDIESVCGFGRPGSNSAPSRVQLCKSSRLVGPHSMALDEHKQILYFVDGRNSLLALDLSSNHVIDLLAPIPFDSGPSQFERQQENLAANCLSAGSKLAPPLSLAFLRDQRHLHSLVWSKVDSSLYIVLDSSAVAAFRPDLSLELVALSSAQTAAPSQTTSASRLFGPYSSSQARHQLPVLCHHQAKLQQETGGSDEQRLGSIRDILLDDGANGHELLVLHQWKSQAENRVELEGAKRAGRLYLAKLALGIKSRAGSAGRRVFDLHSARSTWDPLIWAARGQTPQLRPGETSGPIDWPKLAERGVAADDRHHQLERIAFIHLMDGGGGFERVDAVQINAEGKMFVLNLMDQTIRTIGAYSPKQFNQVKRNDLTLDKLLATSPGGGSGGEPLATSSRFEGLSLISLRNPMRPSELLSFHSASGLLAGLTQSSEGVNLEFSYKILTNYANNNNNNDHNDRVHPFSFQSHLEGHQIEISNFQTRPSDHDEDDQNDLDIRRLIFHYVSQYEANKTAQLTSAMRGYVRLNSIVDLRRGEQLQFVRKFSNSQFVLQTILLNDRPICTLNTDLSGVLTKFIQQPSTGVSRWVELVYEPRTYLLRNVITKSTSTPTSHLQSLYASQTNVMLQTTFPYDDKLTRSTKRIIYDEIFNHYCDLFIVDA